MSKKSLLEDDDRRLTPFDNITFDNKAWNVQECLSCASILLRVKKLVGEERLFEVHGDIVITLDGYGKVELTVYTRKHTRTRPVVKTESYTLIEGRKHG